MPSPYQYPWTEFSAPMRQTIGSSITLLYKAPATTMFDSILVTNTTNEDIFVDFWIAGERIQPDNIDPAEEKPWVAYKRLVPAYNSIDLIPQSVLILLAGDFAYTNSDNSSNTFSCIIAGRQFLETQVEEM